MKIIKKGEQADRFPYNVNGTCGNCGCVFRLEPRDPYVDNWHRRYVRVDCPQCGSDVLIADPANPENYYGK